MRSNIEARIIQLEVLLKDQQRQLRDLQTRLAAAESGVRQSQGLQYNWQPGGGGGGSVYFAVTPSSGSWAGGAPPSGSAGFFTANVYKIVGGSYSLVASGATIYNGYPSSPGTSKTVTVALNEDGTTYSTIGESCT